MKENTLCGMEWRCCNNCFILQLPQVQSKRNMAILPPPQTRLARRIEERIEGKRKKNTKPAGKGRISLIQMLRGIQNQPQLIPVHNVEQEKTQTQTERIVLFLLFFVLLLLLHPPLLAQRCQAFLPSRPSHKRTKAANTQQLAFPSSNKRNSSSVFSSH